MVDVELAKHCSPCSAHRSHEILGTHSSKAPVGKGDRAEPRKLKTWVKMPRKLSLTFSNQLPHPLYTQSTPLQEDSPYIYLYSYIDSDRWHHHYLQKRVQKNNSCCFFKAKFLNLQQEISYGMGNFQKDHFSQILFMYNVSHLVVAEKLIQPPKRVTILPCVQSRPTHFLLYSTTHAAGERTFQKKNWQLTPEKTE